MIRIFEQVKGDLQYCDTREEMLEYFIDLGRYLDNFPAEFKKPEHYVPGCVSDVYIIGSLVDGRLCYKGEAGALIVKGYLHILLQALNGLTPQEVLNTEIEVLEFIAATGIDSSSLASRANAFGNMYLFMKKIAERYV